MYRKRYNTEVKDENMIDGERARIYSYEDEV